MELTVNGAGRSVPGGASVADLVREMVPEQRGVAVAVNGEVVPRAAWPATVLRDGDLVEVLTAAQGG
ncbi:sulfur carrier protein ThiS [Micromonospora sp. NPDC005189]|uniref:sulfur carrier protein ThiS n=1 Tax=unclassified Micromonospora TaxID=2617518 RepID=UPI0033A0C39E